MERIDGTIVRTKIDGEDVSFFVTTDQDTIMGQHAWGYFYETEELAIIKKHFRPHSVMLDVGANVGNHTIYAAKFLQARKVICIEPNEEAVKILRVNIDLNRLHSCVDLSYLPLGLSDRASIASVKYTVEFNLGGMALRADDERGSIRLVAGDDIFQDQKIEFIKLDVEGMEIRVLKGLEGVIAANRPSMFVEVDNDNFSAFQEFLRRHDYLIADRYNRYGINENFMVVPREPFRAVAGGTAVIGRADPVA